MARTNGNGRNITPAVPILAEAAWDDHCYARLLMRLDLFDDMIVATRYERIRQGGHEQIKPGASFVVDPEELAARLSNRPVKSDLLPPGCLFWQQREGQERLGVFIPPQQWALRVAPTEEPNRRLPLPGLILVGQGREYKLWAVKETAQAELTAQTMLYQAPVPNMSRAVCAGNVDFPQAGAVTIGQAVKAFFESDFNNHLIQGKSKKYPDNILQMWRVLNRVKAAAYPLDDLIETRLTLEKVING